MDIARNLVKNTKQVLSFSKTGQIYFAGDDRWHIKVEQTSSVVIIRFTA